MKPNQNWLNLALLGVLIVLAIGMWRPQQPVQALAQTPAPAPAAECDTTRSVQVTGTAVINVTPDRSMIQLGVQSSGATPDATQQANMVAIKNVIAAVRALGVDAKDIATDTYIVYPVYDNYNSLKVTGYRISNTIMVTLRDISLADDVILVALKSGANMVQDVQFYTSDLRKYRDQARDLAMKAAGEKAQAMAVSAGSQTGCVLTASENSWSHYYGSWQGSQQTAMWAQNVMQNASSQGAAPQMDDSPISLGQIAVEAQVSVSYSLK
jgi:uncharacterized protein